MVAKFAFLLISLTNYLATMFSSSFPLNFLCSFFAFLISQYWWFILLSIVKFSLNLFIFKTVWKSSEMKKKNFLSPSKTTRRDLWHHNSKYRKPFSKLIFFRILIKAYKSEIHVKIITKTSLVHVRIDVNRSWCWSTSKKWVLWSNKEKSNFFQGPTKVTVD